MGLHDMLQGWLYLDTHKGIITVSEIYESAEEEIRQLT
jgi:hypothetical protein